jgi:outer membrane protein
MNIRLILSTLLILSFAMVMHAQKYGFLNSTQLILIHPEVKAADQKLTNYQNDLLAKGDSMVKVLELNYGKYVEEVNGGTLSKLQMQEREAALGQEQEAIRAYEAEIQTSLVQKREELYKPILDAIQKAVQAVGKEEGYTFIFDSSTGVILHASETENVFDKVKAKLAL